MVYGYKRKRTYGRYKRRYKPKYRRRSGYSRRSRPVLATTASRSRFLRAARYGRGGGPPGSGVGKRKATWGDWGGHLKRAARDTYRMSRDAFERSTNPMYMSWAELRQAGLPIPGAPAPVTYPEPSEHLIGF